MASDPTHDKGKNSITASGNGIPSTRESLEGPG
jgi:hypothetical protein